VFVPPDSIPGFDSPPGLQFDPESARAELRAAGWFDRNGDGVIRNEEGEPFPTIEMLYSTGSYHQDIALAIGADWKEHLGLDSTLDGKELKVYRDERKAGNFMVARGGWFGDYGDPTTFLDLHRTGNPNNDPGYSDSVLDGLLDQARDTADPDDRMLLLEEAERYTMMETLPVLPIWHYNYYYMYRPPYDEDGLPIAGGLRGISQHPRLVQYFWQLEVISEEEAREARRQRNLTASAAPGSEGDAE
jgi:oligopeptide transport system substrate-binding protein